VSQETWWIKCKPIQVEFQIKAYSFCHENSLRPSDGVIEGSLSPMYQWWRENTHLIHWSVHLNVEHIWKTNLSVRVVHSILSFRAPCTRLILCKISILTQLNRGMPGTELCWFQIPQYIVWACFPSITQTRSCPTSIFTNHLINYTSSPNNCIDNESFF